MGLFSIFGSQHIDSIEWSDTYGDVMVHRFSRDDKKIRNGAQLHVAEGQVAVVMSNGMVADQFPPGNYRLDTESLPELASLNGWEADYDEPLDVDIYYVNTRLFAGQKWGTKNPITISDERYGLLEIRAFGTYVFRIKHRTLFIKEVLGSHSQFTNEQIADQLRSLVVSRFTDAVGESNIPVEAFAANNKELGGLIQNLMGIEFEKYGLELTSFVIENISMPEEVKKEIFELSRLNKIDVNHLAKLKLAKALGQSETGVSPEVFPELLTGSDKGPPAPPKPTTNLVYYVVDEQDGEQKGPFDLATIKELVLKRELTPNTLVWKSGMNEWATARSMEDFDSFFAQVPPPLPK